MHLNQPNIHTMKWTHYNCESEREIETQLNKKPQPAHAEWSPKKVQILVPHLDVIGILCAHTGKESHMRDIQNFGLHKSYKIWHQNTECIPK